MEFRGPATMLIQTDASRLKADERETATKIAAKLKQLRSAAGVETIAQCGIAMRGQKVAREQVSPDVTIVDNSWITLAGRRYVPPDPFSAVASAGLLTGVYVVARTLK